MPSDTLAERAMPAVATITVCILLGLTFWAFHPSLVDDAFISFRYALNLVEGRGLVYNPGENVEGYTNLLWTLIAAGGLALGFEPENFSGLVGWSATILTLCLSVRLARRVLPTGAGRTWVYGAPVLIAACPAIGYWAGAGLEAPLFCLLWVASRERLASHFTGGPWWPLAVSLVLLPLCRPDGLIPVVLGLGVWLFRARRSGLSGPWLGTLAIVVASGTAYALWKLAYYGEILPNTFAAKVSGPLFAPGLQQVASFALAAPWVVPGLLGSVFLIWGNRPEPENKTDAEIRKDLCRLLSLDCWVMGLYVVSVGGDAMPFFRFFVPLVPLLAVLTVVTASRIASSLGPRSRRTIPILLCLLGVAGFAGGFGGIQAANAIQANRIVEIGRLVGRLLHDQLPGDAVVATNTAGAIAYYSERTVVDSLGLNDRHIARATVPEGSHLNLGHSRGDGAYVLMRDPDVVILGNSSGSIDSLYFADWDLVRQPGFADRYHLWSARASELLGGESWDSPVYIRTLVAFGGSSDRPTVHEREGILERPVTTGVLTLREFWATDVPLYLYLKPGMAGPLNGARLHSLDGS